MLFRSIIGASNVSRLIANYLEKNDRHVVLIDSNHTNIAKAKEEGLEAFNTNIYSDALTDNIELNDMGYLMALTGSSDINKYAINKYRNQFGENGAYRLVTEEEMLDPTNNPKEALFSHTVNFPRLTRIVKKYPVIHEIEINDEAHFKKLVEITINDKDSIPLFVKDTNGELEIISSYSLENPDIAEGYLLVYLGKPMGTV